MGMIAEYAVRISNLKKATVKDPNGRRINFYFTEKVFIPKECKYVEIKLIMNRLTFKFLKDRVKSTGNSWVGKVSEVASGNIKITSTSYPTFIKKISGWEGEYDEIISNNPSDNTFFLKKDMRHIYKNISNNSSYETPVIETDISSTDDVVMPINETKPTFAEVIQKQTARVTDAINKVFGVPEPIKLNPEDVPEIDPRDRVNELFKELTYQAHKCTDEIQNAMADIWDYQLRKVHVTYEECNRNIKLQQILLKYIALQDELEKISSEGDDDGTVQK